MPEVIAAVVVERGFRHADEEICTLHKTVAHGVGRRAFPRQNKILKSRAAAEHPIVQHADIGLDGDFTDDRVACKQALRHAHHGPTLVLGGQNERGGGAARIG